MAKYHSLLLCNNGVWGTEFGSYDKKEVEQEKQHHRGKPKMLVTTEDTQEAIEAAIKKANEA